MPQSIEEIVAAVLEMSEMDRYEVLDRLEASMKPPSGSLHPECKAVIQRRSAELDSGLVEGIPWEEVCRQADARYGADRPIIRDRTETSTSPGHSPNPEWSKELKRRSDAHMSGEEPGIPWEEVCRRIELRLAAENATDA